MKQPFMSISTVAVAALVLVFAGAAMYGQTPSRYKAPRTPEK